MTITNTGVAVAVAVVVGLGFLFFGPQILTPFNPHATATMTDENDAMTTGAEAQPAAAAAAMDPASITELRMNDIKVGTGAEAAVGDTVTVEYVGALTDGTVFDSSKSHGQSFSFALGMGAVIKGWDLGLVGMKEGGQRVLIIPAALAYGPQAVGSIPANSPLIFQVELVKVQKGAQ